VVVGQEGDLMLEYLFVDRTTLRRLRSCVLARHLEEFAARLQERGYVVATIRQKISVLGRLARWMGTKGFAAGDLDEGRARAFVAARSRQGWRRRDVEQTVLQLIEHLRSADVLVRPAPTRDDSASAALLGRYERYLREGRPCAACRRVFLCTRAPRRGFCHVSSVSTIVARAFTRAGLEPPHRGAHTLRHSLAATMVRRGATLSEIGEVLRHRSPATTEIYAKLDFGALRDVAMPWPTRAGGR
jgi:site-specific recombinase XerD